MEFVSRETWGAIVPRGELRALKPEKVQGIVVHHTTGRAIEPESMIRAHDNYHKNTRGWAGGLAYNWLVSADGRIWEGRGWNQGGATKHWNDRSVAVAYLGDSNDQLPEDAKRSLEVVFETIRFKYGQFLWLKVHSDNKPTDCPGGPLRAWVGTLGVSARKLPLGPQGPPNALLEIFQRLRAEVEAKPLRRWRKNSYWPVYMLQSRLNEKGFNAGTLDGKFGRKTKGALKKFQRTQLSIRRDGVCDTRTWDALFIQ